MDASCQTFHSGANVMVDKETQCPEDFTYITEEHKYAHERTKLLKPVIAFAAASQPFSTQVYIHNPAPAVAAHVPHPASVTPSPPSSLSPMSSHASPSEQQLNMDHTSEGNSPTPPHQPCGDTPWSTNEPSLTDPPSQSPDTSDDNDISSGSSYEMSEEESSSSDSDGEPDELHLCKEKKYVVFESQLNRLLYSLHCNACANGHIAELQKQCVGTMLKVTVICVW